MTSNRDQDLSHPEAQLIHEHTDDVAPSPDRAPGHPVDVQPIKTHALEDPGVSSAQFRHGTSFKQQPSVFHRLKISNLLKALAAGVGINQFSRLFDPVADAAIHKARESATLVDSLFEPGRSGTEDDKSATSQQMRSQSQQQAVMQQDALQTEACLIAPRTLRQIRSLAAQPLGRATPMSAVEGPVDQAVVDELWATVREVVACSNAGDILRRLALYSDQRIHSAYPKGPTRDLKWLAKHADAVPRSERVALIRLDKIALLADGRATAVATVKNPSETVRLVFAKQGDRWLIDCNGDSCIRG